MSNDGKQWVDLASRSIGAGVVYANDELFADRENLIKPQAPVFQPHTFGNKGQIMDGWETRRRREHGSDSAIVRLGCAGVVRWVVVDTSYFTGNYPPEVSVEACGAEGYPSPGELAARSGRRWSRAARWTATRATNSRSRSSSASRHVRLTMFPDGGVARLRVYGEPVPDPRLLPATIDLAASENGAVVTGCSNMFYSSPANLLMPGLARVMGDGWETSRRRDEATTGWRCGWPAPESVEVVELDTSHFVGNAPGWATLSGDSGDLLARTALQPDTRHRFAVAGGPVDGQVRLDIYPDGGMARLRVFGAPTPAARTALADGSSACCPGRNWPACCGRPACRRTRRPGGRSAGQAGGPAASRPPGKLVSAPSSI